MGVAVEPEGLEELYRSLPAGFRARRFEEPDREAIVAMRNADAHPMQRWDTGEWRRWEALLPDLQQVRVVVEEPGGEVIGFANLETGGVFRPPDGAVRGGIDVAGHMRSRGIGSALLTFIEGAARRLAAPRYVSAVRADTPDALRWATRRGYIEIGRRMDSYLDLAQFAVVAFGGVLARAREAGFTFASVADLAVGSPDAEKWYQAVYDVEAVCWADVPYATPVPHWPYESFRRAVTDPEQFLATASVVALAGERVVAITLTGKRGNRDGLTWFTGTLPEFRGRGLARAVKLEAIARAKTSGLRALLTTNDEANIPMRKVNEELGYKPLPAVVQLEKRL